MNRICVLGAGKCFRELLNARESGVSYHPGKELYDLAAILPGVRTLEERLDSRVLLLWSEHAETLLRRAAGERVVSCGFSPRDTLTLSSLVPPRAVLTVQRQLLRPDGRSILPQDIPLPEGWGVLPPEEQVMLAGLLLLGGGTA